MKNNYEQSHIIDSTFKVECFQPCSLCNNYFILNVKKDPLHIVIFSCNSDHCHIVDNLGLKKEVELISLDNILDLQPAPASFYS